MFCSASALAQPEDAVIKTVEGKKYYVHTVAQGNTLYGIHKLYKTELDQIISANPGLSDNLTIGQQILIPISENSSRQFISHIVQEGETLYGISKQYGCDISEIKSLNPGVENGLKIGQELKLPNNNFDPEVIQSDPKIEEPTYDISYSDSLVKHEVLAHETLYSIAKRYMVTQDTIKALNKLKGSKVKKGDILLIPVKKVNYEILEKEIVPIAKDSTLKVYKGVKKDRYTVALLLPFMFDKNDAELSKPIKFGQVQELYPTTKIALQFYQGFMLALDSLKKAGLSADVYVYDTRKDTAALSKIFDKDEFQNMDLVVGPFYPHCIDYAAKKCAEKNIRIVLPFKADPKVLHENPMVFKPVTSNMSLMDGAVDYIVRNHAHHNIVILKPYSEGDKALYQRAVDRFNTLIKEVESYNDQIVELNWGSSSGRDLNAQLPKDTTTVVLVPSNDVKYVTGAMNRLNKVMNYNPYSKNMKVIAFGFEDWNKYDDIDILHRNRLNQHYATYRFVDYNFGQGLEFVKSFRKATGVDPTVYSTQGFDVGYFFMSALHLYGTSFETVLEHHNISLVQNDFGFRQIAPGSGYENKNISVVRYQNFELVARP